MSDEGRGDGRCAAAETYAAAQWPTARAGSEFAGVQFGLEILVPAGGGF